MAASFLRPQLISDEVYDYLKHELLVGNLSPGAWLRETELAKRLKVSRTPIREAVKRLSQEGLLQMEPNRGIRVREPSLAEVLEAYEVRKTLEGMAARLAATQATEADLAALGEHLMRMKTSAREDFAVQIQADNDFHRAVAQASGNRTLVEVVDTVSTRVTHVKIITRDHNSTRTTHIQHEAIVMAITSREPRLAEQRMHEHIDTFVALVRERMRSEPDVK